MSKFVRIIELYRFKEVTFYTISYDDQKSLGLQFLENNQNHDHFEILITWIKNIGEKRGAQVQFFRNEREANALPPPIELTHKSCKLRWYCLRMSRSVVILFNGGEKTPNVKEVQNCPVLFPLFDEANRLSRAIWKAFDDKEFNFNNDDRLDAANIKIKIL